MLCVIEYKLWGLLNLHDINIMLRCLLSFGFVMLFFGLLDDRSQGQILFHNFGLLVGY